ncbi:MAG: disulfide reductase [Rhodospirillales bacterium RIFCSPLOWO2_12_FULL_58_28]|nr:MAG: disulfide reductase [Rhodospirillales bacterium RIFCSPLOWO2_02_FULL_58_16]OHC78558.1 MAG: disulfide reductase [Rhodospirillales bacterium RIFCSPLOWO2_12_FULL_58_28]
MTVRLSPSKETAKFIAQVERLSGQDLLSCYQCGRCTSGCPMAFHMDILPNQIIRFAQLGMKEKLLNSKSIWMCVTCYTCNSRCPKGVRIAEVIESLRQINLRTRKDHLQVEKLTEEQRSSVPPIALVCAMRKFTS